MWSLEKVAWTFLTCFAVFCIFGSLAGACQDYAEKNGKLAGIAMRILCYGSLIWLILNI